jgi:hypothetical protein
VSTAQTSKPQPCPTKNPSDPTAVRLTAVRPSLLLVPVLPLGRTIPIPRSLPTMASRTTTNDRTPPLVTMILASTTIDPHKGESIPTCREGGDWPPPKAGRLCDINLAMRRGRVLR